MSHPSKHAPHIIITDELIAARHALRTNLVMSIVLTLLVWASAIAFTVQSGFNVIVAYLFVGSLEAMRNLALAPHYYIDRPNPAVQSILAYGKIVVAWLPMAVRIVYLGVREAMSWDEDDFRVQRMMSQLELSDGLGHADDFDDELEEGG